MLRHLRRRGISKVIFMLRGRPPPAGAELGCAVLGCGALITEKSRKMDSQSVPFTVQQRYFWTRPGGDDGLHTLIPFPFLLLGPLDPERLGKSIQQLIDRHDALRIRVVAADGAPPRQKFLP